VESNAQVIREERRQRAVESLGLNEAGRNAGLDRVTRLACSLFGVAMSSVTVMDHDRALYPGRAGFDSDESPRQDTPCHLVIDSGEVITTDDATSDPRFADIAPIVALLAAPEAHFVTAGTVVADGGIWMGL